MIEVGEFVRINNDFRLIALGIGKVIRINQDTIYVKMNFELPIAFKIDNIAKHNKNILELLEVEDYVNGYKVLEVCPERGWIEVDCNKPSAETTIWENEIKTILTHEQYKQNAYEVKE